MVFNSSETVNDAIEPLIEEESAVKIATTLTLVAFLLIFYIIFKNCNKKYFNKYTLLEFKQMFNKMNYPLRFINILRIKFIKIKKLTK